MAPGKKSRAIDGSFHLSRLWKVPKGTRIAVAERDEMQDGPSASGGARARGRPSGSYLTIKIILITKRPTKLHGSRGNNETSIWAMKARGRSLKRTRPLPPKIAARRFLIAIDMSHRKLWSGGAAMSCRTWPSNWSTDRALPEPKAGFELQRSSPARRGAHQLGPPRFPGSDTWAYAATRVRTVSIRKQSGSSSAPSRPLQQPGFCKGAVARANFQVPVLVFRELRCLM